MNKKWFALGIDQVEKSLRTNAAAGLSRKAARSRWNKDSGSIYVCPKKSIWQMLWELVSDFSWAILVIVAVVSFFFDEIAVGAVVLTLLVINAVFSLFIYHRSRRNRESTERFFRPVAKVIRGGKLYSIDYSNVVPGDVVLFEAGDFIGCDARLIRSDSFVVNMHIDKEKECVLEKNAGASVNETERYAYNMTNMVHANSTVLKGSARAIVTAVGRYTYFSALTGGIERPINEDLPKELFKIKKFFSVLSIALLISILPVCIIGLLMSNLRGGTVYLSEAFLLMVALSISLVGQRACTVFQYFYVYFLRNSVLNENPAVIRSVSALNKLSDIDYVFLLDGCLLSDGIFHYSSVIDADDDTSSNTYFSDIVYLYRNVESRAVSAGISSSEKYYRGIDDFLSKNNIDVDRIRIRYSTGIYSSDIDNGEKREIISFTDGGQKKQLCVYRTPSSVLQCDAAIMRGKATAVSKESLIEIEKRCIKRMLDEEKLLIFTVSDQISECFVGALSFREGKDVNAIKTIQAIQGNRFAKVIVFADNNTDADIPEIPEGLYRLPCVKSEDFAQKNLPVTYQFGSFPTYCGMSNKQIEELIDCAHGQNKKVAVVGFSEFAPEVISKADIFVTCAPVASRLTGYLDEEIKALEISGVSFGSSCNQAVKEKADILISRPLDKKGGLQNLLRAFWFSAIAKQNLNGFFRFVLAMFSLRVIFTVMPMLLGDVSIDARHVLFFMTFFDLPVFLLYSTNRMLKFNSEYFGLFDMKFKQYVNKERSLLIAMLVGLVTMLAVPYIPELFEIEYLYKTEYQFVSLVWIHLAVLYYLYYEKLGRIKEISKNKAFVISVATFLSAVALVFLVEPLGLLFGIQKNPLLFILLSFVPCASLCLCMIVQISMRKKNRE